MSNRKLIEKVESWIDKKDLNHGNAEVFEQDQELFIIVEGYNHTTLQIVIGADDMEKLKRISHYKTDFDYELREIVSYAADHFDTDEYFTEVWSKEFADHNGFTPREFLNALEKDKEHIQQVTDTRKGWME